MGLELGRGCCGSGFQDLSGMDPDTAANLVKMILVEQLSPSASTPVAPLPDQMLWRCVGALMAVRSETSPRRARPIVNTCGWSG